MRWLAVVVVTAASALVGVSGSGSLAGTPPVVIDGVSAGSFSAVVRWHVDRPARVVVVYGLAGTDAQVWSKGVVAARAGAGETRLSALEPGGTYTFSVIATAGPARWDAQGSVTAGPVPAGLRGRTVPGAFVVNGQRFFPRMVFAQCPYAYPASLTAGINLFMGAGCTTVAGQLANLAGKALSVTPIDKRSVGGPGLVGWYQQDEADEHVSRADAIPLVPSSAQTGRVPFLTLTNHFYDKAAPPPQGRGIYTGLIARAEMIGFDLYPLQGWCRKDALSAVFDAQTQLVQLAQGKPTYQWIEAGPMNLCYGLDPSPAIVRAETWLAIAGGACGVGYFPDQWRPDVAAEVGAISGDIASLSAALLDESATAWVAEPSQVRAGVRLHDGATYVIAVNPTFAPATARITVPGLGTRGLRLYGNGRWITASDGVLTDSFRGLQVKIYVAPPPGVS